MIPLLIRGLFISMSIAWLAGCVTVTPEQIAMGLGRKDPKIISLFRTHPDWKDMWWNGAQPLHEAAASGNIELAECLLKEGADVNAPLMQGCLYGETPMIIAAKNGNADMVKLLISHGADLEKSDLCGLNALHYAELGDNLEVMKVLLDSGAKINPVCYSGATPLDGARGRGHEKFRELLMSKGGMPSDYLIFDEQFNRDRWAKKWRAAHPLHSAILRGDLERAMQLIKDGADVNATVDTGMRELLASPLMIAVLIGDENAQTMLLQAGANINQSEFENESAAHIAAWKSDLRSLKILLEKGKADINLMSFEKYTALDIAILKGDQAIAKYLRSKGGKKGLEITNWP